MNRNNLLDLIDFKVNRSQSRRANFTAFLLFVVFLLAFPYAEQPFFEIQPFFPSFISIISFADLMTSYLLFSQFRVTRSFPLLMLAGTYFYSGIVTIPHILTFQGIFSATGLLGAKNQTAIWFWVFWHGGFALGTFFYLLMSKYYKSVCVDSRQTNKYIIYTIAYTLGIIGLLFILATSFHEYLPVIFQLQQGTYSQMITSGVGPGLWLISAMSMFTFFCIREEKSLLNLWLGVAIFASLLDVLMGSISGGTYSIGWYVSRVNSLFCAIVVLCALIYEVNMLYYKIAENEIVFRGIFENSSVGIAIVDMSGNQLKSNPVIQRMLGYDEQEQTTVKFAEFMHPDDVHIEEELYNRLLSGEKTCYQIEKRYVHREGKIIWGRLNSSLVRNSDGKPLYTIRVVEDITKRKEAEEKVNYMAYHDSLTELPNRRFFQIRLRETLKCACEEGDKGAVMFVDLDQFKQVNDTLGHDAGDILLKEVAKLLKSCVRGVDIVARMGGDEFTILLPNISGRESVERIADRIVKTLGQPIMLHGSQAQIGTSIGIALYPENGFDVDTLLKHADAAVYWVKDHGRNHYKFFDDIV